MKHPRLSAIFIAVSAASLLTVSASSFATHTKHHKAKPVVVAQESNMKGEANFKAEVPPPCPPVRLLLDGFYVGVGVGYDSYRIHSNFSADDGDAAGSFSTNQSATGWMGSIFAGYGRYFDWFYLAGELSAATSNASSNVSFNATDDEGNAAAFNGNFKARTTYGIHIIPGIKLSDSSLLYVRAGWVRTNSKVNVSGAFTDADTAPATNVGFSDSNSRWTSGGMYGVGIETYVADNVSVRGEYTYTSYNNVNTNFGRFQPSNNEFELGLLYHFS